MVIDKNTREKWRKLSEQGMHSSLGEYTPVDEFVALLDSIDELEAQLTPRALDAGCSHAYTHDTQPADYKFCPWCGGEHRLRQ